MSLIGKYNEHDLNFTAYEKQKHSEVGDQIIFLGGSGSFTFQVDEGVTNQVRAGISFKMPEGQSFNSITFNENAGATGNILFAVASGSVVDARSVISGETPVLNSASPNDELQVKTKSGSILDVNETNMMRYVDFTGYTRLYHGLGAASSAVLITAAANTDGFIIAHLFCASPTSGHQSFVALDDVRMFGVHPYHGTNHSYTLPQPIKIPSGVKVSLDKQVNADISIIYKAL